MCNDTVHTQPAVSSRQHTIPFGKSQDAFQCQELILISHLSGKECRPRAEHQPQILHEEQNVHTWSTHACARTDFCGFLIWTCPAKLWGAWGCPLGPATHNQVLTLSPCNPYAAGNSRRLSWWRHRLNSDVSALHPVSPQPTARQPAGEGGSKRRKTVCKWARKFYQFNQT